MEQHCTSKIWICSWVYSPSRMRRRFYHLGNSAKIMSILMSALGVKHHTKKKEGRTIPCNTENYVPKAVPGLSSGSLSFSAAPLSTTSSSQDSTREESSQRPIKQKSQQNRRSAARGASEQSLASKELDYSARGDSMRDLPVWLEGLHQESDGKGSFSSKSSWPSGTEYLSTSTGDGFRETQCVHTF